MPFLYLCIKDDIKLDITKLFETVVKLSTSNILKTPETLKLNIIVLYYWKVIESPKVIMLYI